MTTTQQPAGFVSSNLPNFDLFLASVIERMPNVDADKVAAFEALAAEARIWLAEQTTPIAPAKVVQTYVATYPEAAAKAQQINPRS